jgi:hypothetical protein
MEKADGNITRIAFIKEERLASRDGVAHKRREESAAIGAGSGYGNRQTELVIVLRHGQRADNER